jgi:hypothetical protein
MVTTIKSTADQIVEVVKRVTKDWCQQRKAEEGNGARTWVRWDRLVPTPRETSIKEAAWAAMERAYAAASGNGRFPANARQIMYAARPEILKMTGKHRLDDAYFTQTLLPDFMEANARICSNWDVVFDARGTFSEPHTERAIGLGTIEVRRYLRDRAYFEPTLSLPENERFPTIGPENRYSAVLFVEKEGFDPLFQAARLRERFDIATMSTKGMSTTAARHLLDQLSTHVQIILVLHDFDLTGFSIFGSLAADNRHYLFENKKIPIIDIGLRLADIKELQSEPVSTSGDWSARAETLLRHGATPEEIAFLRNRRVELNAMTSGQFVEFIENKLSENGVTKVLPNTDVMVEHARRLLERRLAAELVK